VVLVVNGGGSGGSGNLIFSPSSFTFSSVNGSTPNAQTLLVSANSSTTYLVQTITYSAGASNWLTVSASSGVTNSTLSVSVNASGLATGTYTKNIPFNANGSIQNVPVTLTVTNGSGTGERHGVAHHACLYDGTGFQPRNPGHQCDQRVWRKRVAYSAGDGRLPVAIRQPRQRHHLSSITATVNSSTMAAGTYSGNIRVTRNGGNIVDIP
jgi:hypothetical protein